MKEQIIRLSNEDRLLVKQAVKWLKFFPIMYLILWIVMCLSLFWIMYILFNKIN